MSKNIAHDINAFSDKVNAMNQRIAMLRQQNEQSPAPFGMNLLETTLEELLTAFEELKVADEELLQQNEELIAARLQIEEEMQRYHELFEFAPIAYLITDINSAIQEINHAGAILLNVDNKFLLGKPLAIFI